MMLKVLIVLAAAVYVAVAQDPAAVNCGDLKKQVLNFPELVTDGPFRVVYSIAPLAGTPDYTCSSLLYTNPVADSTYDLASTYITNQNTVLSNLQLTMNTTDGNMSDSVVFCGNGATDTHNFLQMPDGVSQSQGYCLFTCDDNDVGFTAFKCLSRGGTGLTAANFDDVVTSVQGVANGPPAGTKASPCSPLQGQDTCTFFQG